MKDEPIPIAAKSPKERFKEFGAKLFAVPKDEIDARDKKWRQKRRGRKTK